MSCEAGSNKTAIFSRLSGGIARLAGKRGFYAGLALGGAGLLGAGVVALRRRQRPARPASGPLPELPRLGSGGGLKPLPRLPARTRLGPARVSGAERCATCGSRAETKPGPWYRINGRSYCQDCAPEAARQADVDLVAPAPPETVGERTAALPDWRAVVGMGTAAPELPHLSPEKRKNTQLRASRVRVYAGQDGAGQPVYVEVSGGFVVVAPDRHNADGVVDTGLAVVPGLKPDPSGGGIIEDTSEWYLVHIPSGKTIPEARYGRLEQASLLAGILAQLDWTREEGEMSTAERRLVGGTVSYYNQALAEAMGAGRVKTDGGGGTAAGDGPPRPSGPAVPLTGKLVADKHGGVARVLEDRGEVLFLVDSLGQRYEVYRDEVRPPQEGDFELLRIARTVDPQKEAMTCARCGRGSSRAGAGEAWYRMNRRAFCGQCGPVYAAEEAYMLDSEIGQEEPV